MEETFRVINSLVDEGVIDTYALGGAIAAIRYVQPFLTEDVDVFISVSIGTQSSLMTLEPLYKHLREKGYHPNGAYVTIEGWDVQFLPVFDDLIDEAVNSANDVDLNGVNVRVMTPEHLVAIMLKTGRPKDFARVKMFLDQKKVDEKELANLVNRFGLEEKWRKYRLSL